MDACQGNFIETYGQQVHIGQALQLAGASTCPASREVRVSRPTLDHRAHNRPTVLSLSTVRASGPNKCKTGSASRPGKAALLQHDQDFG
jgi:hypothetical protein